MLDFENLKELENDIKSVEYSDHTLIITLMNGKEKVVTYSDETLDEIRNSMLLSYSFNKKKYRRSLDFMISYINNSKIIALIMMLASFAFLYNLDIQVENKILSGIFFAFATLLYQLYKDGLKDKYLHIKLYLEKILYYIDNREDYKKYDSDTFDEYSVNIEEVNHKGMSFKKLKRIRNSD